MAAVFSGGQKLAAWFCRLRYNLSSPPVIEAGFVNGAVYPDGRTVAQVAEDNEYGDPAKNRPPRPFMRQWRDEYQDTWPKLVSQRLKANGYRVAEAMDEAGAVMVEQLKDKIRAFSTPALSPNTIRKKGSDKPLIETSVMLNNASYLVRK